MYKPGSNSVSHKMISAKVNDLATFWEYRREDICDTVDKLDVPCNSMYQVVCQHTDTITGNVYYSTTMYTFQFEIFHTQEAMFPYKDRNFTLI